METPKVSNRRVDLLGESDAGDLIHIELQSRNERRFALRMAEYRLGIARSHGRLPRQVALYVGETPLRMRNSIEAPDLTFRFRMVDIRDLDGERLLASENMGDNVTAVLTRLGDQANTVRRILKRIADGAAGERDRVLAEFFLIAGLRKLTGAVEREAKKMPILNDIMDDEVIGPLIRQGRAEGRIEGQLNLLMRQIEKRFGDVPPTVRKQLTALKPAQLERVGLRLLDAIRIEDLFAK